MHSNASSTQDIGTQSLWISVYRVRGYQETRFMDFSIQGSWISGNRVHGYQYTLYRVRGYQETEFVDTGNRVHWIAGFMFRAHCDTGIKDIGILEGMRNKDTELILDNVIKGNFYFHSITTVLDIVIQAFK